MSKESLVIVLGLIVLLTPSLGIPRDYKEWISIGVGALLMIVGYQLRRKRFLSSLIREGERKTDAFTESDAPVKQTTTDQHPGGLAI